MTAEAPAVPRRGLFTYENALVLILGVTFGVVFFDRQAASNLVPFLRDDLRLNDTQVGLIGSALSATWALSAYLVGLLSDSTGVRKLILIICVVGFSLCSVVSGLAPNYEIFIASRFFMGLLEGGVMPICLAIMVVESQDHRRGLNAGIVQNGFSNLIGNSLGPVVLVAVATAAGWRNAFFVAAVPGLLCALAIWLWVKEPAKDALHDGAGGAPKMSLLDMLKVRNVLVCALVSIFMVGWLVTGFAFLPARLTDYRGYTPETMSFIMSTLGFCAFLGGALLPGLSDRMGRKPILIIGSFASVLSGLAMIYVPQLAPVWILTALLFIGWVGNGIFPMFMGTIPGESLPRAHIATAMGIVVGIGEILGGVAAPILAGWLSDTTSLGKEAPLWVMVVFPIIAGVIALFLTETAPAKLAAAQGAHAEPLRKAA